LNLANLKGVGIAKRIVGWADVVLENFSSGTMERLGLGYEDLKKVNPGIVMVSLPMFGHSGPLAKHPGLESQLADLIGFGNLTGWPDRPPVSPPGAYTDFISPHYAVSALMGGSGLSASDRQRAVHRDIAVRGRRPLRGATGDGLVCARPRARPHRQRMSGSGSTRCLSMPGA
jgi:hypothetical protein